MCATWYYILFAPTFLLLLHHSHISRRQPLGRLLTPTLPQSKVAQATSQHECRGVPAASKGERNSSGCFFGSARLPNSFTHSSCPSSSQHSIHDQALLLSGQSPYMMEFQRKLQRFSAINSSDSDYHFCSRRVTRTLPRRPSCCCITGCCCG